MIPRTFLSVLVLVCCDGERISQLMRLVRDIETKTETRETSLLAGENFD